MTTIHAVPPKRCHSPVSKHHSLYRKNSGWLIKPDDFTPGLSVQDNGRTVNIDIKIPGVTKNQVEVFGHKPCIKRATFLPPSREEIIHVTLSK